MTKGHTLKLNSEWDLCLDEFGNIATITGDEAIAQNVCNALRLFTNDAWFDPDRGIDHFNVDLGVKPLTNQIRARFIAAAESVDGVAAASVTGLKVSEDRKLSGLVHIVTTNGGFLDVAI